MARKQADQADQQDVRSSSSERSSNTNKNNNDAATRVRSSSQVNNRNANNGQGNNAWLKSLLPVGLLLLVLAGVFLYSNDQDSFNVRQIRSPARRSVSNVAKYTILANGKTTAGMTLAEACATGPFFVTPTAILQADAASECAKGGGSLLDITNANIADATTAIFFCSGPNTAAWAASYYGNNYGGSPMGLTAGSQPGAGSFNVYADEAKRKAVCMTPPVPPTSPVVTAPSNNKYFIVPSVLFSNAQSACDAKRGDLVAVTNSNFNEVTKAAFDLNGANSIAWIASWNGDNYQSAPIALTTGSGAPGGAINERDGSTPYSALCLLRPFTPPQRCVVRNTFFNGATSKWTVCRADAQTAWISSIGSGQYQAQDICVSLGYRTYDSNGGTCGTTCGYCDSGSCESPGHETYDHSNSFNGPSGVSGLAYTVTWRCTM